MDLNQAVQFVSNIDIHLIELIEQFGAGVYSILFLIIFLETGAVIMSILPGDSLLVGAGAFAATKDLNLAVLLIGFYLATVLGDTLNFHLGQFFGRKYHHSRFEEKTLLKFINKENFEKVNRFFSNNGRKSFLFSRFIPVARSLMPFSAGFTQVNFPDIFPFILIGNALWSGLYVLLGFFVGNMDFFQDKFHYLMIVIFLISMIPTTVYLLRSKRTAASKE